jgi:hypothetical protein
LKLQIVRKTSKNIAKVLIFERFLVILHPKTIKEDKKWEDYPVD